MSLATALLFLDDSISERLVQGAHTHWSQFSADHFGHLFYILSLSLSLCLRVDFCSLFDLEGETERRRVSVS